MNEIIIGNSSMYEYFIWRTLLRSWPKPIEEIFSFHTADFQIMFDDELNLKNILNVNFR